MFRQCPRTAPARREARADRQHRQPSSPAHSQRLVAVGSAVWLALLALGCPQLLADGFSLSETVPGGPFDPLSSQGGSAAWDDHDAGVGRDSDLDASALSGGGVGGNNADAGGAVGEASGAGGGDPQDGGADAAPNGGSDSDLCTNGRIDPSEQGVDCGGACPACQTCGDGLQNQDETGIDCGGVCGACPTCNDGLQNQNETGIDCGGVCQPCESCNDGLKNQNETGVDCGGICSACGCTWGPFGVPEMLTGLGFPAQSDQWGPALSPDALTLMMSKNSSGGTEDLYVATRTDRGAVFSIADPVVGLNTTADEGTPFFSFDALSLYFFSAKAGGLGARDIYVSKRSNLFVGFSGSSLVGGVNSVGSDHMPWLPADELTMYFTSSRSGGSGGYDLWVATRADRNASFGNLRRLTELNTSSNDEGASLMADELTIFFASNRPGGSGVNDIWMAERTSKTGTFDAPVNVAEVNTAEDELNVAVTADGRELFFSSDRGTGTNHVIWRASRTCQ